jgi:transcriptional regulator of arginine metabolism
MAPSNARHSAIARTVLEHNISTQDELARHLKSHGFQVTQATISRDIVQLGIIKVGGSYTIPDRLPPAPDAISHLKGRIVGVKRAGENIAVLFTNTGEASSVGLALDRTNWPEIVGTVAGDDTVFVACQNLRDTKSIIKRLENLIS